VFLNSAEEDVG